MLTLDEAINHCFEVANDRAGCCEDCAKEHEQLAEWLTDYKRLLAFEDKIKSIVFSDSPDIAILKIRDVFTGESEE